MNASSIRRALAPSLGIGAAVAACWWSWLWYAERVVRFSDQRVGLAALAVALVLAHRASPNPRPARSPLWPAAWLVAYAASFPFAPPIVRASLAFLALGASLESFGARSRLPWGAWCSLLLALPWIASLQFYLGYPLRVASGEIAALFLRAQGLSVERTGTLLTWGERVVSIDAPCSGVRMLWTGLALACAAGGFARLAARPFAALLAITVAVVVLANGVRSAALFSVETGLVASSAWTHDAIGLVCFALVAAALLVAVRTLERRTRWRVA